MPAISKIRFTNIIYENGQKRYNDDTFQLDGHNGAILLENGGGKTVFVQTVIQAVLPHSDLSNRKIKSTLMLENGAAHIAVEWILSERPRRYALTAVTLFMNNSSVDSLKYVYEYEENDDNSIDKLPFVKESVDGKKRPTTKEEIGEYYSVMSQNRINAHVFNTIKEYHEYIEKNFKIIPSEWRKIALINGAEGDVEAFFDACKTTGQLVDNLLIPTVEEAVAGNGTKEFAETFEKQREHFKKYKQLKTRIDESRQVEEKINFYVREYETYDKANLEFVEAKENVKALYNFAKEEESINDKKIAENENSENELEKEEKLLKQKEASYKLKVLNEEMTKAEKTFLKVSCDYNEIAASNDEKQKKYENLKMAKYRQDIKTQKEKMKFLQKQVETLDKDETVIDINEKLLNNSSELRGYYLDEEEKINKEKYIVEGQLRTYESDTAGYEKELLKIREKETNLVRSIGELDASIKILKNEMAVIEKSILDNPEQEKVEEQFKKWQSKIGDLEKSAFDCKSKIKLFEEEKGEIIKEIPSLRDNLNELKKEETRVKERLRNITEKHDNLLNKVKGFRSSWFNYDSLYSRQETILVQVENKLERLREEKENLIFNERLAHRWLDDYNESEYYTSDALIEKSIRSWRNQFKYLESGTEYIQRAIKNNAADGEFFKNYPYWSIAIITSDSEVNKLIGKIEKQRQELSHPVIVMTEKEARDKIKSEEVKLQESIVFPLNWEKNIIQSYFENWKKEISVKADEATKLRKDKEVEFTNCSGFFKEIKDFYNRYPHEDYIEMQKHEKSLCDDVFSMEENINGKENRIKVIDDEVKKINSSVLEFQQEQGILEQKILKAQEYSTKKSDKEKAEQDISIVKENLEAVLDDKLKLERKIKMNKAVEEEIKDKLSEIKNNISKLKLQDFYEKVLNASPKYTGVSKEVLVTERKTLKDALQKKQKGREELEERVSLIRDSKEALEKDFDDFKKKLNFEIDETFDFPMYGDSEISKLLDEIKKSKSPLKNLKLELDSSKSAYENKKSIYDYSKEEFYKEYEKIIDFPVSLDKVQALIKIDKDDVSKKKKYVNSQRKLLEKEKSSISEAINELKIKNGRYLYLAEEIKAGTLSKEIAEKFPYNRLLVISEVIDGLNKLANTLKDKEFKKEEEKQKFVEFCKSEIVDVKLKDMAITGVEYKKSFKDILDWQSKMGERIMRTIEIAEDDIRGHDKEVQQFINHLHSYLVTMAQELKQIPKKTKIRIDDNWKEVFSFTIPEWDEKEGKEELSNYIDWMLRKLEEDKFRDENGAEKKEDTYRAIGKWLQSKQLLQIVMKQNTIKVKCRKVTNDKKMSSQPFSWEISNSWSGGEKWSKNMTLFLGILNYLAEKRTQIISSSKIHRTVIVDNPFGKASSDHVLDPVFFIAKQLGFQIIALTAHAEGKFIRTYFPIVYSCKLRDAVNGSTQIMIKEREIKKVFFMDNDPQSLLRLGEFKQMDLFDYNEIK